MKSADRIRESIIEKLGFITDEEYLSALAQILAIRNEKFSVLREQEKQVLNEVNEPLLEYSPVKDIIIENQNNQIILKINKNKFDKDFLVALIKRLQFEIIVNKSNFNTDVLNIAEEIKAEWWTENEEEFLKDVKK